MTNGKIFKEGLLSLNSYKTRTVLMALGTMIGIAALTAILCINAGTKEEIKTQVSRFGVRAILILPGHGAMGNTVGGKAAETQLKKADAAAISDQVKGIEGISANASQYGLSIKADRNQIDSTIDAVEANWHDIWDWPVVVGDRITQDDVDSMARVCLLGTTVARELFGDRSSVGETVQIGSVRFKVKGILESRGMTGSAHDRDRRVNIPLSTGMKRLFNQQHISLIRIKVKKGYNLDRVAETALNLLNQRHHIDPKIEQFFTVYSTNSLVKRFRGISGTVNKLLTALTALSLLAGGLVMMNILLASVGERKSEIGLRRAVGATRGDVYFQFLGEALGVNFLGLILGWVLGLLVVYGLQHFSDIPASISWQAFLISGPLAVLAAIVFGLQPARRASRLDPIEALK